MSVRIRLSSLLHGRLQLFVIALESRYSSVRDWKGFGRLLEDWKILSFRLEGFWRVGKYLESFVGRDPERRAEFPF
jgi:hypothetical protein